MLHCRVRLNNIGPNIMAISSGYYGLRKGSTKSHTYSVLDGKQITKDRVEGGKNPRTYAQMVQRCMITTIGSAYSTMKTICDHSFEGKSAGMQCMREFSSRNMMLLRTSHEYNNGFFGFNKYQQPGLVPGSYIISDGSLPDALVDACVDSVDASGKKVTMTLALTDGETVSEVAEAMGCKNFGDMCTVALMYPKVDGSYGFGAVRFTYISGASVLESFTVAVAGDAVTATPTFTANKLRLTVRMAADFATDASAEQTYMTAITSRKVNSNWLRSKAQFNVTDAAPSFSEAIATYPIGQERFLNGEVTSNQKPTSSHDNVPSPDSPEGDGGNTGGNAPSPDSHEGEGSNTGNDGGNTGNDGGNTGGGNTGGGNTGGGNTGGGSGQN